MWFRIGKVGGLLWVRWRTSVFHKIRWISWQAAELLASHERLCRTVNGDAVQGLVELAVVILLNSDGSSVSRCPRLCRYSDSCHMAPPAWSAWTLRAADAKTGVVRTKLSWPHNVEAYQRRRRHLNAQRFWLRFKHDMKFVYFWKFRGLQSKAHYPGHLFQ